MIALRDIQAAFIHDIYTGERTSLSYLDAKTASAERLDIYQNNTVLGLTDILANAFPVLKKIVGDEFFKTIARYYIKSHPQPSGNRHAFGDDLAGFLEEFKPAASLPYLRDVAALEWAYFQAALAHDAKPLDFESLTAAMSADPAFALAAHPSVHIVQQKFNALEIWQEHQKEDIGSVQLETRPHRLAVWRGPDDAVLMRHVTAAFSTLIEQSQKGTSFAEAMAFAGEGVNDMQKFQKEFSENMMNGMFVHKREEVKQ